VLFLRSDTRALETDLVHATGRAEQVPGQVVASQPVVPLTDPGYSLIICTGLIVLPRLESAMARLTSLESYNFTRRSKGNHPFWNNLISFGTDVSGHRSNPIHPSRNEY
jgi:hypothetical protein